MTCPFCKSPIAENSNFCEICGQNITREDLLRQKEKEEIKKIIQEEQNASLKTNSVPVSDAPIKNNNTIDVEEKAAKTSMICGIASLLIGPIGIIPAIVSVLKAKQYRLFGNGNNTKKAKLGKTLSLISIISWCMIFVVFFSCFVASDNFKNNLISKTQSFFQNSETTEEPTTVIVEQTSKETTTSSTKILYEKPVQSGGEDIYDENDTTITLRSLTLKQTAGVNSFSIMYNIKSNKNCDVELASVEMNGDIIENPREIGFGGAPRILNFVAHNISSSNDIKSIICNYTITDKETGDSKNITFNVY